jgi:hypothetical protein
MKKHKVLTALTLEPPETAAEREQRLRLHARQYIEHLAKSLTDEQFSELRGKRLKKVMRPAKKRGRPKSAVMETMFNDHLDAGIGYEDNIAIIACCFKIKRDKIRNRFPKKPAKK